MSDQMHVDGIKIIGHRILVLPEDSKELTSKGGIILAQTYENLKKSVKAKVIQVGEKAQESVQVGDFVHYQPVYDLSVYIKNVRHVVLDIAPNTPVGNTLIVESRD